ncbi:hypothetical protein MPSEU_000796400 [Mayamaea pseudoterrestris]|nr:hypothetical protein MPSEU_000796400 [Mayamaea pseudoterrestris]
MFRNITDRIVTAASAVAASAGLTDNRVSALTALGFEQVAAQQALQACDGNVDRAAELLLASPTSGSTNNTTNTETGSQFTPITIEDDDDAKVWRQVIDESRRTASVEHRRQEKRSAASIKAGQAAVLPTNSPVITMKPTSLALTHPRVNVLAKLQDKPTEEQILRCADRLKSFPAAVDTLHRVLSMIQANPDDQKYRSIDKSLASYQRSIGNAIGADDFIQAMQFLPRDRSTLVLDRHLVDPALLYLGISALEQTKLTPEYNEVKQLQMFRKDVSNLLAVAAASESEATAQANFLSKCPTEPPEGRGALMTVILADQTLRRRFDGDDTLADVIHWLGGHGNFIYTKLLSREWSLFDKNAYPLRVVSCDESVQRYTLQYLGCWPSGFLEILPTLEERKKTNASTGSMEQQLGSAEAFR